MLLLANNRPPKTLNIIMHVFLIEAVLPSINCVSCLWNWQYYSWMVIVQRRVIVIG